MNARCDIRFGNPIPETVAEIDSEIQTVEGRIEQMNYSMSLPDRNLPNNMKWREKTLKARNWLLQRKHELIVARRRLMIQEARSFGDRLKIKHILREFAKEPELLKRVEMAISAAIHEESMV